MTGPLLLGVGISALLECTDIVLARLDHSTIAIVRKINKSIIFNIRYFPHIAPASNSPYCGLQRPLQECKSTFALDFIDLNSSSFRIETLKKKT